MPQQTVLGVRGSGSPEGSVTADVGTLYVRTDSSPFLYVKESGTGNTGWVARVVPGYASITVEGNATVTSIASSATNYQITVFSANGVESDADGDHTNDHITIGTAGTYLCELHLSFSGGASDTYSATIRKNNGATQLGARLTRKLGTGGDVGSASTSAVVSLSASDTVEAWIQNEGASNDVTIQDATLSVVRVG